MNTVTPQIDAPRLINRLALRLMPLLGLLYLVAYLDRSNIGFAKLQMLGSLGISEAAYGLGASLFFIGYLLFEVPSNVMLHKYGATRWIARIMFTWGVVTILLAFTKSPTTFYFLRFLLGASEAGLYPGVIYYLTLWFPAQSRARMLGYFTLGSSMGNMIGAPICGWLLDKGGFMGLDGWQLVFVVTGLPSVLLTVVVLLFLPETPDKARFLNDGEKRWLDDTLSAERAEVRKTETAKVHVWHVLTEWRVIGMALYYMMLSMSVYGIAYWLPTLVKGFGVSNTINGMLNVIPWLLATIILAFVPARLRANADGRDRIGRAMLISAILGMICFLGSVLLPSNTSRFVALCIGAPCLYLLLPLFWTMPPRFLTGARAAAGIAAINSLGNIGGFIAQNIVPWVRQISGSTKAPMLVPATCLLIFAIVTAVLLSRRKRGPHADDKREQYAQ
ncbi:MFS transporter [Robbsia sp. KACC 23696]|uniref:MFS transporter n=1 Tax=Robbsia sp. KACC 23696 TaxID=3149231 RepID=UPI00325A5684